MAPTHLSLYRYIWTHSRRDQLVILAIALLAQPFYFLTLTLPKLIVNGPIRGDGFEGAQSTQPFLHFEWSAFLSAPVTLMEGVSLGRVEYLMALSCCFLLLVGFNGYLKYLVNTLKGRLGERLLRRLRYELIDRVLRFPPAHLRKVKQSEVSSMVKDEVEPLGGFTGDAIVWPVFLAGQAFTALLFIFVQNYWLGIVSGAVVLGQALIIPRLRKPILKLGKMRQLQARELAGRVGEIVDGGPDIRVQGTSNWERADIVRRLGRIFDIRFELYQRKYFVKSLNNFIAQLTPFIFYAAGGYFVIVGDLDIGQLLAVIVAYKDLPGPIKELIDWDLQRQDVEIKYNQVMDQFHPDGLTVYDVGGAPSDAHLRSPQAITLKNLTAIDDAGFTLLDDLDLEMAPHQSVAITGATGSGKEAFGSLFAQQLALKAGTLLWGDQDVAGLPELTRGKKFAYAGSDPYFFPTDIRENLLYGLRLSPQILPESSLRKWKEAQRTGNPLYDADSDWIDYGPFGTQNPKEVLDRIVDALERVGLEAEVYQLGLQSKLSPQSEASSAEKIIGARLELHRRLSAPELSHLVEKFDANTFNKNASIAENILFGASSDARLQPANLPKLPHFQRVVAEEGLEETLVQMGLSIAETMLELFRDFPPDHPFFEEFSFIPASELPAYQQIMKRHKLNALTYADRSQVSVLPLNYVDARHRLALVTPEIQEKLIAARKTFAATLPQDLAPHIAFYDIAHYHGAANLLDNILMGRVAYGVARAQERVAALIREVLDQLDVRDLIIEAGLSYNVGAGGKRLTTAQRQKLGLARALIKEPDYLIVNAALSNLDDQQKSDIVDRVLSHRKGRATLWVLTKTELENRFDRTIVFDHGRIRSDSVSGASRAAAQ